MMIIYYVVVMGLHGVQEIDIERFSDFAACEAYMHKNHKRLTKEYYIESQQRMSGSGCKRVQNG